jgi:tripartite-type tricarboxylate transporter receptor subunit TctC
MDTVTKLATVLIALLAITSQALAQDFPNRPVRFVNGFTPGGGSDTTGRLFADRLSDLWKQQAFVENRPGAGGSIAAEIVHKSAPDGYTVLIFANTHLINQVVYPKLPFNLMNDFVPLALVSNGPLVIAVNPAQIPAKDLKEFTALLKGAAGKHAYTACNVASAPHFAMEMYKSVLGIDALHVPHKGCGPAVNDMVAGHIGIGAVTLATALPFIKQDRLRPIALISAERTSAAPDIPTMRESGIPELKDFSLESYFGFVAPAGTPPAVAQKLEADLLRVAALPEVRKRIEGAGMDMFVRDSKTMRNIMRADYENLAKVAKEVNIKAE